MSNLRETRFTITRVLVVGDTCARVIGSARLAALVRAAAARPLALTFAVTSDEPGGREKIASFLAAVAPGHRVQIEFTDSGTPARTLLAAHGALLAERAVDERALVIEAWQHGLCVVNSVEQAIEAATFDDQYFDEPTTAPARPWYSIMEGSPVVITNPQRIVLGYGVRINPRAVIHNEGTIAIDRGSLLGADAELNLWTAGFRMGRFCHTSSYFAAVGSRHTMHVPSTFAVSRGPYAFLGEPADEVGDIAVGNDVWFGMRVILLPGVHVADGSVVGAGSVVTHNLTEPYGVYAGNPARLLHFRFPPHVIKWLGTVQWWNWPTSTLRQAYAFFRTDLSAKTEDELWRLVDGLDVPR